MALVADHRAGAGGGQAVTGQDHLGPVEGGDLEQRLVEAVASQDPGPGQFGGYRVLVAAEGHQRLGRRGAFDGDRGRERGGQRGEGLAGGDGDHGGLAVGGGAIRDDRDPDDATAAFTGALLMNALMTARSGGADSHDGRGILKLFVGGLARP